MKRTWAFAVLAGVLALIAGCEGDDAGDVTGADIGAPDTRADAVADAVADVQKDVAPTADAVEAFDAPADATPDAPADATPDMPADAPGDAHPDAPRDVPVDLPADVTVPPGCCLSDADCGMLETPVALACAFPGWDGEAVTGVCKPVAQPGWCWRDADCPDDQVCHGAAVCPCNVDCDMSYEGPGRCIAETSGCTKIDPSWVLEWCDAASLVIWDGSQCVGTCFGCCECGPFCDLVFHSMAECQAACIKKPCDAKPELTPFQLWAVFPNDDGGMGGGQTETVSDDAEIQSIGEPEPTLGTDGKQVTFRLPDGTLFKLLIQLPSGIAPPLSEGQQVHLFAQRYWPWWTDLVVVVWPTYGGWPLFFGQAASQSTPWYDCGGTTYCPTATFLPSDCEPFEMTCGQGVQPPVHLMAAGQITETEISAVLQQGEIADGYPGFTYGVASAYELTEYQCADYPSPWNASFIVRTYEATKMTFGQDNTPLYEFYELCVKKDAPEVEALVKALDSTLYCGVGGVFAGCDQQTEMGCHGDLEFVAGTKALTPAKWAQLKALSLLDAVTRIAGGHWL